MDQANPRPSSALGVYGGKGVILWGKPSQESMWERGHSGGNPNCDGHCSVVVVTPFLPKCAFPSRHTFSIEFEHIRLDWLGQLGWPDWLGLLGELCWLGRLAGLG